MPLYEYRCAKCGKVFETLQKFSDQPLTQHPDCGGSVERLISTSSFQLKGGGWYATDYAKSGSKPVESKSADNAEGKSDSKSDSKAESKSESKSDSGSESKSETKSTTADSKPAPAKT